MNGTVSEPKTVRVKVRLAGDDWQLETMVTVPTGPMPLRVALPMVQALADHVVDGAIRSSAEQGKPLSCKKGCGACCRQLVPIAEVEARHIRDVVEALPEPRRSVVRARFADARRRLEAADMLDTLERRTHWEAGESRRVGVDYFEQGIPCPFLEAESCSIYADRPVACREYLVTSPAENCAQPTAETIEMLPVPLKMWTGLARFDPVPEGQTNLRWVPLILAPAWAEEHPAEPAAEPGPDVLQRLFQYLAHKKRETTESESSDDVPL